MASSTSLAGVLPALLADLPDLLDEVAAALGELDPTYAAFLSGGRDEVLPAAEFAIAYLVAEAGECLGQQGVSVPADRAGEEVAWALFEELGRDQWRRDAPLRTLLSAYQVGGRVGWRRISKVAVRLGVPPDALAALAEAVFQLVDDLSTATIAGYVEEQAQSATERERLREELAERLLSDRADTAAVGTAARAAGWPLPAQAAVVLLREGDELGRDALARMTPACLVSRRGPLTAAVLPDPGAPGARARLLRALRGTTAVVGPTVPLERLPESLRVAQAAVQTLDRPAPGGEPLVAVDHLDTIIVHRDRGLLDALRAEQLRPLEEAAAASRPALRETLRAWLVHMGNVRTVSAELGVHPQTVRYRLGRLQELFGAALEDPASRLRLLLALGWEPGPDAPVSDLAVPAPAAPEAPERHGRRTA